MTAVLTAEAQGEDAWRPAFPVYLSRVRSAVKAAADTAADRCAQVDYPV